MQEKTMYLVVRLKVQVEDHNKDTDEIVEAISSGCDYNFTFEGEGLRIIDTEIIAAQTDCPE